MLNYFEIFKAILKNKNSKAPGEMVQGSKAAMAQWYGDAISCLCSATVSSRCRFASRPVKSRYVEDHREGRFLPVFPEE